VALTLGAVGSAAVLPPNGAAAAPGADIVTVELDRSGITTGIGHRFTFTSTIQNTTDQRLNAVAHLNVLSPDGSVYVDPEDWSSDRTKPVPTLPAHGSRRLTWTVQAVNRGHIVLYVAVVANGKDVVDASGPLRATVIAERTINAGGVLPIGVAVPAVALALLAVTVRRRRTLA
jgi:hypothetical protein